MITRIAGAARGARAAARLYYTTINSMCVIRIDIGDGFDNFLKKHSSSRSIFNLEGTRDLIKLVPPNLVPYVYLLLPETYRC